MLVMLVVGMLVPMTRFTGCADACEEAVDHCLDCDVEVSTCHERYSDAPHDVCEQAVDRYRAGGCDPYAGSRCEGQPDPGPP